MNQQTGGGQQRTENQEITAQQRGQAALNQLMRDVKAKRADIEAVLPADIKFEKFQACLNMAVRREPKLLECTGPSLIRAVLMCAYDGLMPDGKEAVIVYRWMSYKLENGKWAPQKRLEASYMPMAFGLRKKIVAAGAAKHIKATVVYANDHFEWEEGLNERLEHKPFLSEDYEPPAAPQSDDDGRGGRRGKAQSAPPPEDPRGPMRAVYSIAILPDGTKVFEVMPRREVMAVREKAQTKDVWDGPFQGEMWKKSVLRRHSKALPTSVRIRDAEAEMMFPDFARGQAALPAPAGTAPPPPVRGQLEHREELPLDLSAFGEDAVHGEERAGAGEPEQKQKRERKKAAPEPEAEAEGGGGDPAGEDEGQEQGDPVLPQPTDPAGWEDWSRQVLTAIGQCKTVEAINALERREQGNIAAAPARNKGPVQNSFIDKRVDLQSGGGGDD